MTARRRGVLLAGLSLLLGGLAASDVARREAGLASRLSPTTPVVLTRDAVPAGRRLTVGDLTVRRIPLRFAPRGVAADPAEVVGTRLAADVPAGSVITAAHLSADNHAGAAAVAVRRGERALEVTAAGSPDIVRPGARVDVLVTRDRGARGSTVLALQDVEVLAVRRAPAGAEAAGARVAAMLRVSVRQAVYLTAAQAFAREIRLLPRAPGDRRNAGALRTGDDLR